MNFLKLILLTITISVSTEIFAQQYYLGEPLQPNSTEFTLLGVSSQTGVSNYRYTKPINITMFGRKIGDIVVGIKNGIIVTTIYNLIPLTADVGVPNSIIKLVESTLSYPLAYRNGVYGVNIDNNTISLSRTNNVVTFNKDRIMFLSSVKHSLLKN